MVRSRDPRIKSKTGEKLTEEDIDCTGKLRIREVLCILFIMKKINE
jgi:hypothetical protein